MTIENWNASEEDLREFCIYNRFDLRFETGNSFFKISDGDAVFLLPYHVEGKEALLGLWLNPIPEACVRAVSDRLFSEYSVQKIHFEYYTDIIEKNCKYRQTNHWQVNLPSSSEELDGRLSRKKRYNLRREKNIAQKELGIFQIREYETSQVPDEIINRYFEFKNASHQSEYRMTPAEYLKNYYVSNVYVLEFDDDTGAILLSCEQGDAVYLENLTYNPKYKRYSLGSILYDEYLKILIQKGKHQLYLGAGHQEYKSYYGAVEQTAYEGTIYHSSLRFFTDVTLPDAIKQTLLNIRVLGSKIKRKLNIKARVRKISRYFEEWVVFTGYDLRNWQISKQLAPFRDKKKLMICAHPDDETLFFYNILRSDPSVLAVCMSNASNAVRNSEFHNAMKAMGCDCIMFNMKDSDDIRYCWKEAKLVHVLSQIRAVISPEVVYTHNEYGEYGHCHHMAVNRAVNKVFHDSEIWVPQKEQTAQCGNRSEKAAFCRTYYTSQDIYAWFPQYFEYEGIEKEDTKQETFCH